MDFDSDIVEDIDYQAFISGMIPGLERMSGVKIHPQWEPLTCTFEFTAGTQLVSFASLRKMYETLLFILEGMRQEQQMTPEDHLREQWAVIMQWTPAEKHAAVTAILEGNSAQIAQMEAKFQRAITDRRMEQIHAELGI